MAVKCVFSPKASKLFNGVRSVLLTFGMAAELTPDSVCGIWQALEMEVLFVRNYCCQLDPKSRKLCVYLWWPAQLRGAFFSGTGDRGQLPALQVVMLVHCRAERNAEKGLNHKGIAVKSCLAKYCFSPKSIFFKMIWKVYWPSLTIRWNLLRGRRNSREMAGKDPWFHSL